MAELLFPQASRWHKLSICTVNATEFKVLTNSHIYWWVFCSNVSCTDYIALNGVIIHKQELEWVWNVATVALFEILTQHLSAEAQESQENISHHKVCLSHWKWAPSEYKIKALPLQLISFVIIIKVIFNCCTVC